MIGVNIDVTQHKLAVQELSKANERLRLAIEAGSAGGWDCDLKADGNVWFGKTHAQLGMTPAESRGSREEFWACVHEDDRKRLEQAFQVAKDRHEEFAEDFRVVWRDGTTHWLRSRGRYYYSENGEPQRMLGITFDITQSKQAEQALHESEQRFRLAAQAGKMYSFEWEVTTGLVVRSPEHAKILGVSEPLQLTHQEFVDKIHPDDRPRFMATITGLTPENPLAEVTYRAMVADGASVWLKSNGRAFFDGEGRMLRVIGMVADVTDQKLAEEALSGMTRKLVEAQEQERARIARELHDDITQRLVILAIEIERIGKRCSETPFQVPDLAHELSERTKEILSDIQALSHELHSSKLEYLGIVGGMRSWCNEFAERQGMEINFKSSGLLSVLPPEISLCLFRVLQEALQNAAKHSGVKRLDVKLQEESGEIHLMVSDSGKGFDVASAMQGRGLGITSMQERVRLVGGAIVIDSKPTDGTTIHVCIPFNSGLPPVSRTNPYQK
jgi:PAS domain S-box-containing protein